MEMSRWSGAHHILAQTFGQKLSAQQWPPKPRGKGEG